MIHDLEKILIDFMDNDKPLDLVKPFYDLYISRNDDNNMRGIYSAYERRMEKKKEK